MDIKKKNRTKKDNKKLSSHDLKEEIPRNALNVSSSQQNVYSRSPFVFFPTLYQTSALPKMSEIYKQYQQLTSKTTQTMDCIIFFCTCLTFLQLAYFLMTHGKYVSSMLSGVSASLGVAILTTCLRMEIASPWIFQNISEAWALRDYMFASFFLCICVFSILA
jgi:hypothetical protein